MKYRILGMAATLLMHVAQPAIVHAQWGPTFAPYDERYRRHHDGFPWWLYQQPTPVPVPPVIVVIQQVPADPTGPLLPPVIPVYYAPLAPVSLPPSGPEHTYTGEDTTPIVVARP